MAETEAKTALKQAGTALQETGTALQQAGTALKNEKVGEVVSTKMQKPIVVEVSRRVPHPLYKRIIGKRKKFYAHDEEGTAKLGDVVRIVECRRSEEHTSELQSLRHLVCRLLLEKKNLTDTTLRQCAWSVGSWVTSAHTPPI